MLLFTWLLHLGAKWLKALWIVCHWLDPQVTGLRWNKRSLGLVPWVCPLGKVRVGVMVEVGWG